MGITFIGSEEILDLSILKDDLSDNVITPDKAALTASWDFFSGTLRAADPIADDDVATKDYVDLAEIRASQHPFSIATQADGNINEIFTTSSVSFVGTEGSSAASPGTDIYYFVSGTVGSRGTANSGSALFGGDVALSGSLFVLGPLGGAITGTISKTNTGLDYLVGAGGIDITTGTNGQITIEVDESIAGATGSLKPSNFKYNQGMTGTLDGSNRVFTINHAISGTDVEQTSLSVYKNGLRQRPGDDFDYTFQIVGSTTAVTFSVGNPPRLNSNLTSDFQIL